MKFLILLNIIIIINLKNNFSQYNFLQKKIYHLNLSVKFFKILFHYCLFIILIN
jgi:hypothetical protein